MRSKILLTLFFLLIFLGLCTTVQCLTVNYDGKNYDFGDVEPYEYTFVYFNSGNNKFEIFCSEYKFRLRKVDNSYSFDLMGTYYGSSYNISDGHITSSYRQLGNGNTYYNITSYDWFTSGIYKFVYSNYDIVGTDGKVLFESNAVTNPFFVNQQEIESGKFDKVAINAGDYKDTDLYLITYYYPADFTEEASYYEVHPRAEIRLNIGSEYCVLATDEKVTYEVPLANTKVNLVEGNNYSFILATKNESGNYEHLNKLFFNIGAVTAEDKEQADRDKQTALLEEQNKTNKGIWDTIKEVLSYINPFSENFFVYKLIELLIEGLKSLFVPSEDFFTNWINNMNDWLSERLGALYYPVDLVVTFLDRIGNLGESGSAIISGNGFEFMGAKVIPAFSYDLNSLLTNDTFKNLHDIYLTVVDVILYLFLIVLAKNTFTDIFGGKYDDFSDIASQGFSDVASYKKYERYASNKQRYKNEHGGKNK